MPVPDYQPLMAPVLTALVDGDDHPLAELRAIAASRLALTEEDLREKIPSGTPLFANRLHWAVTYMYQAGPAQPSQARRSPHHRPRTESSRCPSGPDRSPGAV
jgi:restriction system protein